MIDFVNFRELEDIYLSTSGQQKLFRKLEGIAESIEKNKCFNEGVAFFTRVNNEIIENAHCYRYIGNIYRLQGKYDESLQNLEKAIGLLQGKTLRLEVLYNLGMLYREHNKLKEAKECFEELIRFHPQSAIVQYSLSCLLIYEGKYYEGWKKHDSRIQLDGEMQQLKKCFTLPEWKNEDELRILILPEQGIGDKIMFAAFFSLLPKKRQYTVVVSTRLVAIFRRSFPTLNVIEGSRENITYLKKQHYDAYCFMGCLPRILKAPVPDRSTFLKPAPYLYKGHPEKLRVGISWRGGVGIEGEKRSVELALWLPILKTQGISFVNLQYDSEQSDIETLQMQGIDIYSDEAVNALIDMDAFASLVSSCDVVITVDNSTAHLAGALGIPTWVLLPNVPNWRWKVSGKESFFYRSIRLFRRDNQCLNDVIKKIQGQLMKSMKDKNFIF